MATEMKKYERLGRSYVSRWERARSGENVAEAYTAICDYRDNIIKQEEEFKSIDPNSKEYIKAERSIDEQKSTLFEMECCQKNEFSGEQLQNGMSTLKNNNYRIIPQMFNAVHAGDTSRYEQLRFQYEKNMSVQRKLGTDMKNGGVTFEDTLCTQKIDELNCDISMKNAMSDKVAQQTDRGKEANAEDLEALEFYSERVRQCEIEAVKMQNEQKIQAMREQGETEEHIKHVEEENARSEKWYK